jgi:hypothetical protein
MTEVAPDTLRTIREKAQDLNTEAKRVRRNATVAVQLSAQLVELIDDLQPAGGYKDHDRTGRS